MEDFQPSNMPPDAMVSARIDIKKFAQFLYGSQINAQNVVCSMCNRTASISGNASLMRQQAFCHIDFLPPTIHARSCGAQGYHLFHSQQ
jgi:hypothetical protein